MRGKRLAITVGGGAAVAAAALWIALASPRQDQPPSLPTRSVTEANPSPPSLPEADPPVLDEPEASSDAADDPAPTLPATQPTVIDGDAVLAKYLGRDPIAQAAPSMDAKPTLTVLPFQLDPVADRAHPGLGDEVAAMLRHAVSTDAYQLQDRSHIAQLAEELKFQASVMVADQPTVVRFGQAGRVDRMLLGRVTRVGRAHHVSAWMIDVRSTRVVQRGWARFWSPRFAQTAIHDLAKQLGLAGASETSETDHGREITVGDLLNAIHPDARFHVRLRIEPSRSVYVEGETVRFVIGADRPCHVLLLSAAPDGRVTVLLPNRWQSQPRLQPGEAMVVPGEDAAFEFPIEPPHGETFVKVIATTDPITIAGVTGETLKAMGHVQVGPDDRVRIGDVATAEDPGPSRSPLAAVPAERWATADLTIITRGKADAMPGDVEENTATIEPVEDTTAPEPRSSRPIDIIDPDNANESLLRRYRALTRNDLSPTPNLFADLASSQDDQPPSLLVFHADGRIARIARNPEQPLEAQRADLAQEPGVDAVLENVSLRSFALPETRLAEVQWALSNRWTQYLDMGLAELGDHEPRGDLPLIAVLDASIDTDDPRLAPRLWRNDRETVNNTDDDGNGLVDDRVGYNFVTRSPRLASPHDRFGHGTFVTSLIAASPVGDRMDVIGVAPRALVLPIVTLRDDADQRFGAAAGQLDQMIAGLDYAMRMGAKVINCSFGREVTERQLKQLNALPIFDQLEKRGVILVCAAGNRAADNDRRPVFPASLPRPNVMSVMAVDVAGRLGRAPDLASGDWRVFTNFGRRSVDIAAPGTLVLGASKPGEVRLRSGTSYAAALTSGAVALVWAEHPEWSAPQVIGHLTATARPLPSLRNRCRAQGMVHLPSALARD